MCPWKTSAALSPIPLYLNKKQDTLLGKNIVVGANDMLRLELAISIKTPFYPQLYCWVETGKLFFSKLLSHTYTPPPLCSMVYATYCLMYTYFISATWTKPCLLVLVNGCTTRDGRLHHSESIKILSSLPRSSNANCVRHSIPFDNTWP